MSSLDVAENAASTVHVSAAREKLWEGGVVKIKIPRFPYVRFYRDVPIGESTLSFLKFARAVRGGLINCFVHTDNAAMRGEIRAAVSVWKKIMQDGRSFLYLDFQPEDNRKPITHRLITANRGMHRPQSDWVVFETPPPLEGLIMLTPPQEDGTTLDRLKNEGWQIQEDLGSHIVLWKMKDGQKKTIKYFKPKK